MVHDRSESEDFLVEAGGCGPAIAFECGSDEVRVPARAALRFKYALAAAHPKPPGERG